MVLVYGEMYGNGEMKRMCVDERDCVVVKI